jgi:glycosyltransferase involved in cell wall biosynthesis
MNNMKKILIVTSYMPSPVNHYGALKRLGTFLQAFDGKFSLDFLFFVPSNQSFSDHDIHDWIKQVWMVEAHGVFQCPVVASRTENKSLWREYLRPIFNAMLGSVYERNSGIGQLNFIGQYVSKHQPDLIFAHRLGGICPFLHDPKKYPPIMFDLDDIEHKVLFRTIKSPPQWLSKKLLYLQIPALILLERQAIKTAKMTFVCSDQDVNYLTRLHQTKKIYSIPNCIDIPSAVTMPGSELAVLFLGIYNYEPNANAAEYLITKIWPIILDKLPSAILYIAGNKAETIPSFHKHPKNVIFTGFVEDLPELYAKVRVVCCPIFVGGGTRIKIIEAAAFGKAIVASDIAAEGLNLQDGNEIMLKNTADEMAAACIELLQNDGHSSFLGKNAREEITKRFDKKNVVQLIRNHIKKMD